jgi:hypothetical protein
MSEPHPGIFGFLSEAQQIQQEMGCTVEESFRIQRERAEERLCEYEAAKVESNVIQFRPRKR